MSSTSNSTPIATPEGSIYAETEMSASTSSGSRNFNFGHFENPSPEDSDDHSSTTSTTSTISSYDDDAEQEWQESLQQLELLVSLVIIPFFGKWVGRRCAYWAWAKFMMWKYPVEVVVADHREFNIAGLIGALMGPPVVASPPPL
ncbi:hypothetical protein FN846DRAFT_630181 [Sphaerosporella brunnea]|uniref:Uncharacterized protein n=1 Tax=Sphaerosporella brunnea TaxID=1250544 RepID=A0A5J5F0Z3_9PEZI|nr:hypothetical protein FN846DRAFT_630181 [Sphaerosporella brunnea]